MARARRYDAIWRDLRARGAGLADDADPFVYQLRKMADDGGVAFVDGQFDRYDRMQRAALARAPFDGAVTREDDGGFALAFDAAVPSVRVLCVTKAPA